MRPEISRCPTCGSPEARLHRAIQAEGEVVSVCADAFHVARIRSEESKGNLGTEISKWADAAMFRSEPMPEGQAGPKVTLLNATPDPLGSLAALCKMYTGGVVRSLADVTDEERRHHFEDVTKSELQGPLEVVHFHFLVENVTRSFTHQMVRQREAFFAQESMRFAVPEEDWVNSDRVPYPPSVASGEQLVRDSWDKAVYDVQEGYRHLIDLGVPAEDARGLMPHSITTRLHWAVSLRGLLYVAGLRLCTQAQFEWRLVMASAVKALRGYSSGERFADPAGYIYGEDDDWQFEAIADRLRPICYQTGRCGFKAKMDRPCAIRERVDANERNGRPSSEWHKTVGEPEEDSGVLEAIHPYEWAADPTAARRKG
jgi:flavin-dependent thymidylate synthase